MIDTAPIPIVLAPGAPVTSHKYCPCQPNEGTIIAYCGHAAQLTDSNRAARASRRCSACKIITQCPECAGLPVIGGGSS